MQSRRNDENFDLNGVSLKRLHLAEQMEITATDRQCFLATGQMHIAGFIGTVRYLTDEVQIDDC